MAISIWTATQSAGIGVGDGVGTAVGALRRARRWGSATATATGDSLIGGRRRTRRVDLAAGRHDEHHARDRQEQRQEEAGCEEALHRPESSKAPRRWPQGQPAAGSVRRARRPSCAGTR